MKKIRIFLFVVIGLLALTSCSLNQTRYPKNTGNDNPIEGVAQYTITLKDYESKEVLGQVTKNEGNHVSEKEFDYVCPEGYEFSIVNEEGQEVDLYVLASDTTVYLKTTVKTYTLCFMENGVKVSSTEVQYGSPIVLPEAKLVPTGYEFAGWYVSEDDGAALYEGTTMPAHAVTLYAKYNKKPFKISFVTGLEALEEYEEDALYNAGERLGSYVPEALQSAINGLEKYTLLGWYKDEQLTEKFTEIAMPSHDITLYAKWSYAGITFRDGEQIISVATGTEGQEVNAPTAPAKVGYNFVGWYLDIAGTTPATFPLIISSNEQNIYAIYTPAANTKYVVEYYTESLTGTFTKQEFVELSGVTGDTANATQKTYTGFTFDEENALNVLSGEIVANGSLVLKVYYSRNSYTISYANCDKAQESYKYGYNVVTPTAPTKVGYTFAGFEETVPTTMPASDVTLTAKWDVNQYTITFDTQGGSSVAAITQDYGTTVVAPADPTKVGYTFAGWSQAVPATMPAESITLTASWTINQYTITFDSQGGSSVAPITQNYGTTVTAPANPTKTGYTFAGWSQAVPTTMPAENITLTASWTINHYTITFDTQGGSSVAAITQDYGTTVVAPADPTKVGYTFAGWSQAVPTTMPAESLTITASWTVNQYTITFDSQGGSSVAPITQNYGTAVTAPANPTKTGYTFNGWSPVLPSTMPAESMTVTAQWTINQYTITFDSQGGSSVAPITQNYGTAVTAPADPTKVGYTFNGWSPALPSTMPAESMTVTAQWTVNQYTITFDSQGGSSVAPITQNYGTAITAPAAPTKVGYTFAGWSQAVPATMPAESITLTASWTINQYTITFDTQGGSTIAAITQYYGSEVTAPANPTKNGYDFVAWDKEIPTTMPAEDLTITALWSLHTYTITYHLPEGASNNGSNLGSYNITTSRSLYGPFYTGYQFDGWFDNEECSGTSISSIPLGSYGDKELWAKFHINSYTLGFNSNGGTPVESITQEYGTTVVAPADPTREGYTFAGWSPALPTTMPGGNYSYTAQWTINQYTITFDTQGGSTIDPITQNYGTAITAPANPTKAGYTFAGWSPAVPATMPAESITLTASWTINQYTITFDTDGGSDVDSITQDYGSTITAPTAPTKEGYEFKGWSPALPETMPLGGLEVTAQWELVHVYTAKMVMSNGANTTTTGQTISDDGLTIYSNYRAGGAEQYVVFQVYDNGVAMSMANTFTVVYSNTSVISNYSNWSIMGSIKGAGTTKATITNNADTSIVAEVTVTVVINPIVTFVLNNESANVVVQAKAGTELTAPTGFTKPGYEFTGWDKEVPATMPATDTTYTAQWESSGYVISYNLDGGEFVKPYANIDEVIADFQADCTKVNGSGIAAWNDSAKLQAMFSDNTLWAKWSWLIQALANATRTGSSRSSYYNPLLADPTAATGYADNVVCQDVFAFVTKRTTTGPMYSGTCILFTTEMLDYVFELAEPAPFTVPEAYSTTSDDIVLPTPYKEGYTFDGWYDNSEFEGDPITTIVKGSTGDVELYAKWGSQIYTISYELNGGQYAYLTRADMAADFLADFNAFAKKSYTSVASYWTDETNRTNFWKNADMRAKWLWIWSDIRAASIAQSEETQYIDDLITDTKYWGYATQNVAIYLLGINNDIWNETYKDTYGGLSSRYTTINATALGNSYVTYYPVTAPATYIPTKATTLPTTLYKLGYTFGGWYDNEACEGSPVTTIAVGSEGNKTFYAKWTPKQYTITFNTNGGSTVSSITQDYGTAVTAPANPTKTGYTFAGWSQAVPATIPAENITITASWTPIEYTITYHIIYGTNDAANPATYTIETTTITLADPTSEGDTFEGWYTNSSYSGTEVTEIAQGSTGNIDLYAKFTYGKRTITFDTVEGSTVDDILLYPGEAIELPADPTKEGYEFVCWTLDGEEFEETTMGYENLELVASWYKLSTISYNLDGGTNASSNVGTYKPATSASLTLAAPTKEGYTFIGWYDNDAYSGAPVTTLDLSVEEDYEVYALFFEGEWEKKSITLDFTTSSLGLSTANTSEDFTVDKYIFATKNAKQNGGYLMLTKNAEGNLIYNKSSLGAIVYIKTESNAGSSGSAKYNLDVFESMKNTSHTSGSYRQGIGTLELYSSNENGSYFNLSVSNANGQIKYVEIVYFEKVVVLTDADKVALDKDLLLLNVEGKNKFELPLTGEYETTISWASDNAAIAIDGANATVTHGAEDVVVTLTATITCGSATDTKEFEITVAKKIELSETDYDISSFDEIMEVMPTENNDKTTDKFYVIGKITKLSGNNVTIIDENGNELLIYKMYSYDGSIAYTSMANQPAIGDCVVLYGVVQNYNGDPEISNAWIKQINDVVCEDEATANTALNTIELDDSYTEDFTLPTVTNVTWSSNNAAIAISGNTATVTRPASGENDAQVVLTATYTINGHSFPRNFSIVVPAEGSTKVEKSIVALTFPDDNSSSNKISAYDKTWAAVIDDYSWTISNFNNNNWNSWSVIKCGRKDYASVGTITSPLFGKAITKVEITIDAVSASNVNSISLVILDKDDTEINTIKIDAISTGTHAFNITSPEEKCKYKLVFDCNKGSNGLVTVSKVEYFTMEEQLPTHTVTFKDGEDTIDTKTLEEGETIVAPTPTKEGYRFDGWSPELPETMSTSDIEVTAQWTKLYTITFVTGEGSSTISPLKYGEGEAVTAPADPTKTGYTFAGWSQAVPATMPAEDLTITASWTINQYTITFDTDGGSEIESITQDYGTTIVAPADPTKEGYTFDGWDIEIPSTMPAEDLEITAKWKSSTEEEKEEVEYTHTFASGELTTSGGSKTLTEISWNTPSTTYIGWDATKGIQIGSSGNPESSYVISTSGISGTIKEIIVNASIASKGSATLSISVGTTKVLDSESLTTSAVNYSTGEISVNGAITITLTNSASKAMYIKSITIVYEA